MLILVDVLTSLEAGPNADIPHGRVDLFDQVGCLKVQRRADGYLVLCRPDEDVVKIGLRLSRLEFFRKDDDPDAQAQIREIAQWREENREAYDRQTKALLDAAATFTPSFNTWERPE